MNWTLIDLFNRFYSYVRLLQSESRIRKAIQRKEYLLDFGPSSLNLMMADICNSQCIMCGHDYKCEGTSERLSFEKIKAIYSHLDMRRVVEVIFGGGGEPFLNAELPDIAEYTRKVVPYVQQTVITNQINSNTEMVKRLVGAKTHFLISVNAATRYTFRAIAGIDAFDKVKENICCIVEEKKRKKDDISIALSIILMLQNIDELPEFIRMSRDLGVDKVKAMYVRIYPDKYRHRKGRVQSIQNQDSLFYHQQKSNTSIKKAETIAKELKVHFEHPPLFDTANPCDKECHDPWKSLFIGCNGELFPCASGEILFMHKVSSKKYETGNILEHPIDEIWNNRFWQEVRKSNLNGGIEGKISECRCCGCAIDWLGPDEERAHIMDWADAENSNQRI